MKYEFIADNRDYYDVVEMCEALEISSSGFYRWIKAEPSARVQQDESLKEKILEVHNQAVGDYGHRAISDHLIEDGILCGRDRTRRLMGELGISGKQSKAYVPQGTDSAHNFGYSPNLLKTKEPCTGRTVRIDPIRCDEIWVLIRPTFLPRRGGCIWPP